MIVVGFYQGVSIMSFSWAPDRFRRERHPDVAPAGADVHAVPRPEPGDEARAVPAGVEAHKVLARVARHPEARAWSPATTAAVSGASIAATRAGPHASSCSVAASAIGTWVRKGRPPMSNRRALSASPRSRAPSGASPPGRPHIARARPLAWPGSPQPCCSMPTPAWWRCKMGDMGRSGSAPMVAWAGCAAPADRTGAA